MLLAPHQLNERLPDAQLPKHLGGWSKTAGDETKRLDSEVVLEDMIVAAAEILYPRRMHIEIEADTGCSRQIDPPSPFGALILIKLNQPGTKSQAGQAPRVKEQQGCATILVEPMLWPALIAFKAAAVERPI